ncbi:MAG: glycosyltransferase family 39 protein [Chloroflexota bacterium]
MSEPLGGRRTSLWALLAFLWLATLVVVYYAVHKPFTPEVALGFGIAAWRVGIVLVFVSLAGGLGRSILALEDRHALVQMVCQAAIGLGITSLMTLITALLGGLRPWLWLLVMIGLFYLRRKIVAWWRCLASLGDLWLQGGRLGQSLALGLLSIMGFTLITALAPALKFDTLMYHLVLPHIYLASGRLVYVPEIVYWGYPEAVEILYSLVMMLAGDQAAAVLSWAIGVLALLGLVGYAAEHLGARFGWVSGAAILSGSSMASALGWAYVDWMVILFGVAFLIALDQWFDKKDRKSLIMAGVFAGLALTAKYSSGILVIGGAVAVIWGLRRPPKLRETLALVILFGCASGLMPLAWWVKNAVATGNPFYPLFFPAGTMDRFRLDLWQGGLSLGNWLDIVFLPLRATVLGTEWTPGFGSSIGPLLFGLSAAAWLGWGDAPQKYRRLVTSSALVAFAGLACWVVIARWTWQLLQSRLYYAFFPALAVLAGCGLKRLSQNTIAGLRLGRLTGGLVLLALWLNVLDVGIDTLRLGSLQVVLGLHSSEKYLTDNLGWYAPAMQALKTLDPEARVLMLWEARSLYCWPHCVPDEALDRWLRELHDHGENIPRSTGAILDGWRQAGFTHLLYYRAGAEFVRGEAGPYLPADWQALDDLLATLPVVQNFGEAYSLYALAP